jgi:hypothetical protein
VKTKALSVLVALVAVLATIGLAPGADAAAGKDKPVFWISLGGTASQHPRYVFFTANAGGYLEKITWAHWGTRKTVGKGTFGTTAPCGDKLPACPDGPGTLVLTKPVRCTPDFGTKEGKKVLVYEVARLTYPDGEGGMKHARVESGWSACREA